jgi:hypothetical protein
VFVFLLRAGPGDFGFSSHGLRGVGAGNVSYLLRLRVWNTRDVIQKRRGKICRLLAPSLSLVVIAGVVIVIVIVGVLAVILLAG